MMKFDVIHVNMSGHLSLQKKYQTALVWTQKAYFFGTGESVMVNVIDRLETS